MKKISIAIALALVLAMALGSAAFAAQALSNTGYGGINNYQATPTGTWVYDQSTDIRVYNNGTGDATVSHLYQTPELNLAKDNRYFTADGYTYYPYEIYLPNEANPANYRIHTNYNKNTDACASCHATHTAVGASLLQWYSVYETCMACHDGTVTTTYNVEDGNIATHTNTPTFGGMFGTGSEKYASKHNVQGSVSIAAAPGGSVVADSATTTGGKTISMWNKTFGCESCHTPHGQGGNARILNPDPNGFATKNFTKTYKVVNDAVFGYVYAVDANGTPITLLKGYPYKITLLKNDMTALDMTGLKISNFGTSAVGSFTYVTGASATDAVYATGTAAVTVKMNIANYLESGENVTHIAGINTYCGACHVDYNTETQSIVNKTTGGTANEIMGTEANRPGYGALVGTYSKAHRHAVGLDYDYGDASNKDYIGTSKLMKTMDDKISCLTCHFAHGTNQDFWAKAIAKWYTAGTDTWNTNSDLVELAGSSALKRLPNMATCEACHQKADANQGYMANTSLATYSATGNMSKYIANQAHETFFAGNTYKDSTTCLICHPSAGDDVMASVHWGIGSTSTANKDFFGGLLAVKDPYVFTQGMPFGMSDRFCGFPGGAAGVSFAYKFQDQSGHTQEGNSCGKCHISTGLMMPPLFLSFMGENNTTMKDNIDCLACHLDTKDYNPTVNKKVMDTPYGFGVFVYGEEDRGATKVGSNSAFDVAEVGKDYKIQAPSNENCMTCHEHAMAGPIYKRQAAYTVNTDIHAAKDMECMDCHPTERHMIAKGVAATDLVANDRPDVEVSCTTSKCHPAEPHDVAKYHTSGNAGYDANKTYFLNKHTAKLACQTCHVKTEANSYAEGALEYVNESQREKGYPTTFDAGDAAQLALFKGGAKFNDFRYFSGTLALNDTAVPGLVYGYPQSIVEFGYGEWSLIQPANYAWRWFNGTGTGMANAVASFGFYDPYKFNDGFAGFRGTTDLPAPPGFEGNFAAMAGMGYTKPQQMAGLFSGYWAPYGGKDFSGFNSFDKELYDGAPMGTYGDKIYAFDKMQSFMPVPRTNFWFLTPQDMKIIKDPATPNDARNYLSVKSAIESPMMYMFFSGMFKPAMDLYAAEFGFTYEYMPVEVTVDADTPQSYKNLLQFVGSETATQMVYLNGYIYDDEAFWIDDNDRTGSLAAGVSLAHDMTGDGNPAETFDAAGKTDAQCQTALQNNMLDTYVYFPMPMDANLMKDHGVAAKNFDAGYGAYEPRVCTDCHKTAQTATNDNPNYNPLMPEMYQHWEDNNLSWANAFDANKSLIDWRALGYSESQISTFTTAPGAAAYGLTTWGDLN